MPNVLRFAIHAALPLLLTTLLGLLLIRGGGDKGVIFVFPLALWYLIYIVALVWRRRRIAMAARRVWVAAGIATLVLLAVWAIAIAVFAGMGS